MAVYVRIDGQRWLLTVAERMPFNSSGLLSGKIHREEDINFVAACSVLAPVTVGVYGLTLLATWPCVVSHFTSRPAATGCPESDVLIDFDINDAVDVWGGTTYSI